MVNPDDNDFYEDDDREGGIGCTNCDEVGLCVTIESTLYAYTGGAADGVRIGLINYGRFPAEPAEIFAKAEALALHLLDELDQQSASIVATDRTVWLSRRPEDVA